MRGVAYEQIKPNSICGFVFYLRKPQLEFEQPGIMRVGERLIEPLYIRALSNVEPVIETVSHTPLDVGHSARSQLAIYG